MTHPITPPPKLVDQWVDMLGHRSDHEVFAVAAQWGADQELEACLVEASFLASRSLADRIRAARRPKPPSLKEQALHAADLLFSDSETGACAAARDTIRRALEALPE
jgi:hypothetical protein